jgi:hypothetical protein
VPLCVIHGSPWPRTDTARAYDSAPYCSSRPPAHRRATIRQTRRILVGLGVGVALGIVGNTLSWVWPGADRAVEWVAKNVLDPFGQIFLRLLFFVVVPLVFASLASGVAQLGNLRRLGPMAARTFTLFAVNMSIGVILGLLMMNLLQPGRALGAESRDQLLSQAMSSSTLPQEAYDPGQSLDFNRVVEMFLPRNLLQAVVGFQLLPLIRVWAVVWGGGHRLGATPARVCGDRVAGLGGRDGADCGLGHALGALRGGGSGGLGGGPGRLEPVGGHGALCGRCAAGHDPAFGRHAVAPAAVVLAAIPARLLSRHTPDPGHRLFHQLEQRHACPPASR